MKGFFTELGRRVYERWQEENFSLKAFPSIATAALEEQPPSEHIDLEELITEFLLSDEQPYQSLSGFGQPELIIYDSPKFYIQLLFWLDGTTDIHQHEFSGAFHVMAGSSIHTEFTFEDAKPITACFRLGNLKLRKAELLQTGRTLPIISGRSDIHALFHLETPSVTVVIRTHSDPGTGPQFTYLPPHIALDPIQNDGLTNRRKQLLDLMEQTGDETYAERVGEMIGKLDFERGFFILQNCITQLRNLGAWEEVWTIFERRHGALAVPVLPTLEEILRRDGLVALRSSIEDVEHRFFLALLLNLERREDIMAMIRQKGVEDPNGQIVQWAEELMQVSESGVWLLDARMPEEIEVDLEEQIEVYLAALRHFLTEKREELPVQLASLSAEDTAAIRQSFLRSSWRVLIWERVS